MYRLLFAVLCMLILIPAPLWFQSHRVKNHISIRKRFQRAAPSCHRGHGKYNTPMLPEVKGSFCFSCHGDNHQTVHWKCVQWEMEQSSACGGVAGSPHRKLLCVWRTAGKKVYMVEREPSIGGHMAQPLHRPSNARWCCLITHTQKWCPLDATKTSGLLSYSEVENVSGYVGNYQMKLRR